jgi:UDP-glucose 4-epimerase
MFQRIAITGVSGYLGSRLAAVLAQRPEVERIVGIDIRPPSLSSPKLAFLQQDIAAPLGDLLRKEGVEGVVHLAFVMNPLRDRRRSRAINVGGTANVINACREARVRYLLFMGSSTAYGAHPDNPPLLTEASPLRPNRGMDYAEDKAEADRLLQAFAGEQSTTRVCILRACPVLGPRTDNFVVQGLFRTFVYKVMGWDPLVQFVHEEDLLRLLTVCLEQRAAGIYNVGGPEPLRYSEMAKLVGRPVLSFPPGVLEALATLTWKLQVQSDGNGAGVAFIKYSWAVSTDKLRKELGFDFRFTTRDALRAFIQGGGRGGTV